jgi:hypothetical protein
MDRPGQSGFRVVGRLSAYARDSGCFDVQRNIFKLYWRHKPRGAWNSSPSDPRQLNEK